ncbi:VanZ family protein [Pseudoalteromonas sp. SSDWG2]|uniref:VanZ family protein n=1 Tax=Pseudoalteromonas sp. SSDWG2 TaxID=3139391 RepID=UPI003BAC9248
MKRNFVPLMSILAFAFACFLVWIIYLANTGQSSVFFEVVRRIPYGDKLGHFLLFGMMTVLASFALQARHTYLGTVKLYFGAIAVFSFALVEEVSQAFVATRTFDLVDLTADVLGIATASYFVSLLVNTYKKSQS